MEKTNEEIFAEMMKDQPTCCGESFSVYMCCKKKGHRGPHKDDDFDFTWD